MRSTTNKWPRCHPRTQFAHTSKCADGALAPTAPYLCTHHESKSHQRPPHPDKPTQHTLRHKTTPKMCVRAHLPHSLQEASTNRGKPRNMRCYVAQESSARCHAAQIRLPKRSGRMFNHTYKPPRPPTHTQPIRTCTLFPLAFGQGPGLLRRVVSAASRLGTTTNHRTQPQSYHAQTAAPLADESLRKRGQTPPPNAMKLKMPPAKQQNLARITEHITHINNARKTHEQACELGGARPMHKLNDTTHNMKPYT